MNLLQEGNDVAVIALWLGHEQVSHHLDLPARGHDPEGTRTRPHPAAQHNPGALPCPGTLLDFLEGL
jgi:hypothetical protein